jgi:acetyl-CoA carboxylase biotin carboxyl carrier protein
MLLARGGEISSSLSQPASAMQEKDTSSLYVISPMVGTCYASPSPEDPAFIKVGDRIEKDTVVCIVEAMKVMNEVKANVSGVVAEILVANGQPVEFGTKLFRITP